MKKIIVSMFIMLSLCSCAGRPTYEQLRDADYGAYPDNYQEIIENYYSNALFDPYSAVYEFSTPRKLGHGDGFKQYFGYAICGTVNAKNRLGGYVGKKLFFFMINDNKIILQYEGYEASNVCRQLSQQ
jgi:hypothetical protein